MGHFILKQSKIKSSRVEVQQAGDISKWRTKHDILAMTRNIRLIVTIHRERHSTNGKKTTKALSCSTLFR